MICVYFNIKSFSSSSLEVQYCAVTNENGKKVVDGYSFRGKQSFLKVVEGFKTILKRGIENDFNGTKFKALNRRKQGMA